MATELKNDKVKKPGSMSCITLSAIFIPLHTCSLVGVLQGRTMFNLEAEHQLLTQLLHQGGFPENKGKPGYPKDHTGLLPFYRLRS